MRKERMTVEEVNELRPSWYNPVELVCDDGFFKSIFKEVKIITPFIGTKAAVIVHDNRLHLLHSEDLKHYPSLKPEPLTFEKIKKECVPTETILVDKKGNKRIYMGFSRTLWGGLFLVIDNGFTRDEEEIKNWEILEDK